MIGLYIITAITLVLAVLRPWFTRIGERRLERDRLELQALHGQMRSELRAEVYFGVSSPSDLHAESVDVSTDTED